MQAMSFNFALPQKENKNFTTCKDQSESLFLMQVYETSYNARI